jgi:hypothetical protein
MDKLPEDSIVVHGDQVGADLIADTEASKRGLEIMSIPAEWKIYNDAAGPKRNEEMLQRLLAARRLGRFVKAYAFHHDPRLGRGTHDMVVRCLKNHIRVEVFLTCDMSPTRASGNMTCEECDQEYWRHPTITSALSYSGDPFLELSCDGRFLKL